ncbi:MAG: hypothetical protein HY652_13385 [Acidobacteria bacterium]|nr:hypothetical protein [Acidobacteriota bacterium]
MKPENYSQRQEQVGPWKINIISYKLGDKYLCTVDNVQPGANLARGEGATKEEAERVTVSKAKEMLSKTRTFKA